MTQNATPLRLVHSVETVAPHFTGAPRDASTAELMAHVSRSWRESAATIRRAAMRANVTAERAERAEEFEHGLGQF